LQAIWCDCNGSVEDFQQIACKAGFYKKGKKSFLNYFQIHWNLAGIS